MCQAMWREPHSPPLNVSIFALLISWQPCMTSFGNASKDYFTSFATSYKSHVYSNLCKNSKQMMTSGEVMCDSGIKQGCSLSPTLFGLYIDELETYLDSNNGNPPCLFNIMVATLLYVDVVVLLSRSSTSPFAFFSFPYFKVHFLSCCLL